MDLGRTLKEKIDLVDAQSDNILTLCQHTRAGIPAGLAEEMAQRLATANLFLDQLERDVDMCPHIRDATRIREALNSLHDGENGMHNEIATRAVALLAKYDGNGWGEHGVAHTNANAPEEPAAPGQPNVLDEANAPDDYAQGGIMYGLQAEHRNKRSHRVDHDIVVPPVKVYGNNGIAVGTWYPMQLSALRWGAHGASNAGIYGDTDTGAWSIIVSGAYGELDRDEGETLYYSAAKAHSNDDPVAAAPPNEGTKTLHASLRTQNPVRVLRSGNKGRRHNAYLPSCGLRYDGLYRVAGVQEALNAKGGRYEQFRLIRLPGQVPLQQLQNTSPTPAEVAAYKRVSGRT